VYSKYPAVYGMEDDCNRFSTWILQVFEKLVQNI